MKKVTSILCPRIMKKLEKHKQNSWLYNTTWSGGASYQVLGMVDKVGGNCSCRRWQFTGIPCSHVVSVIFYNNERPENYVHDCYKITTYLDIYSHTLHPTHDRAFWPKSDQSPMIPPQPVNNRKGRKTILRRREAGEEPRGFTKGKVSRKGVIMKCSICGAAGHNKRFHGGQHVIVK